MDETVNITDDLIKQHLKDNKICFSQPPWILKTSSLGGRGVFTSRPVKAGEILFIDTPLIIGPRAGVDSPKLCVVCYKNYDLKLCSKNCGILICSNECQESEVHKKECELILKWKIEKNEEENEDILRFLTPVRSLFLSGYQKKLVKVLKGHIDPKHGFEVDSLKLLGFVFEEEEENFLRLICSILDANAFAVSVGNETNQASLRGLYPLASLANHRCYPNVTHVFDSKQRMITKAVVDMEEGTEIFHSYTRIIWSTIVRRYNLVNTKHFCCYCERCEDPSEFGTDLSAIFCNRCKGKMLPVEPLSFKTRWKCRDCSHYLEQSDAKLVMSILGSALARFVPDDDVEKMLNFIEEKTKNAIPVTNQIIVEIKYKLVWILGYKEPYTWNGKYLKKS